MLFAFVVVAMFFWLDPNSRTVIEAGLGQAQSVVNAQFPLFFAVVTLTLLASAFSWLMSSLPRRGPQSQFRVVKRYWVQQ